MNTWEDERIAVEVNAFGKQKIVLAGLWTSVCIVGPALSAIDQGFEVYVIADACGDVSTEAHEMAMQRMIQMGASRTTLAFGEMMVETPVFDTADKCLQPEYATGFFAE